MKKLYATLAAVALTASSAFAIEFSKDLKSVERVPLQLNQIKAPKHHAELSYLNCIETPKSRVDVPVEFDGNLADFTILVSYDSDGNQTSCPSNITVDGTKVTFSDLRGYSGIKMVGEMDPEGNVTFQIGQALGTLYNRGQAVYDLKLYGLDVDANTGKIKGYITTGNLTLTMAQTGKALSSNEYFGMAAYTPGTNELLGLFDYFDSPMAVIPTATVEYSYTPYDTSDTGNVKQDVWHGFINASNGNKYFLLSNVTPMYEGVVTVFGVYQDAFVAVSPVAVLSFPYTSGGSQYYSGDMMLVNETEMGYSFPMMASLTPSTISNTSDLDAVTLKDWAIVNPYTSLNLFNSFFGKNVTDAVVTIKKAGDAGVNNVVADPAKAPAQYFNLQGMQLTTPEAGQVVIVKEGNSAKKVIF